MCFSAQASFVTAALITFLGFLALKKIKSSRIIPFATIPLFFALQQSLEGIVWLTMNTNNTILLTMSMYGFLFFAGIFWPLWTPWSLWCIELKQTRKNFLVYTCVIGLFSVALSCVSLAYTGVTAKIMDHHIAYQATKQNVIIDSLCIEIIGTVIYSIATVIPFFISTVPFMWLAGLLITIGFIVARIFYYCAFASVWCFFAALISGAICFIVGKYDKN